VLAAGGKYAEAEAHYESVLAGAEKTTRGPFGKPLIALLRLYRDRAQDEKLERTYERAAGLFAISSEQALREIVLEASDHFRRKGDEARARDLRALAERDAAP
jgi:hypothetical protein